jgi:3',5'-cyclic-AMP phosphodiesterase
MAGQYRVFSVEDTSAQLVRGPELVEVTGLAPGSVNTVEAPDGSEVQVATLALPPGPELFRFAAINDLHLGARKFGFLNRMEERPAPAEPHPVRCARSAIADALAWGAQLLMVKGDLTHESRHREWALVGELLAGLPVPVAVIPGNHDAGPEAIDEARPALAVHGLHLVHGVEVLDLPGLRLVLVDSCTPFHKSGTLVGRAEVVLRLAARTKAPVVVAMHHHLEPHAVPVMLPRGIPHHEGRAFLDALATVKPNSLVTCGHTHRYRRHQHGPVTMSEVGSTKDYPGAWSGYVVHQGGIRQVVRRVSSPDCLDWLEYSGGAVGGLWRLWSPGRLQDRCFSLTWSATGTSCR